MHVLRARHISTGNRVGSGKANSPTFTEPTVRATHIWANLKLVVVVHEIYVEFLFI